MPFGLTNAPVIYQDIINDVLREYLDVFIIAYLDDILVYSNILEDYQLYISRILEYLEEKDLRLNPGKYKFYKKEVNFLGFIIGRNGICINPVKIKAVKEQDTPTNVKEIKSFIGFMNYNRKFIRNYLKRVTPLTNLTKDNILQYQGDKE